MEVITENNYLKEVKLYKKNEIAMYDMFALYEYLITIGKINTLTGITLVEKFIKDLEDPDINISYKYSENIVKVALDFEQSLNEIGKKYDKVNDVKKYAISKQREAFFNTYKSFQKTSITTNFNLIKTFISKCKSQISMFLVSDIPMNKKIEIFEETVNQLLIEYNNIEIFTDIFLDENSEKLKELLDNYNEEKLEKLLKKLMKKEKYQYIYALQDKYFDFNNVIYKIKMQDVIFNVSTVVALYSKTKNLDLFTKLYQSRNYLKLDEKLRNNNDCVMLNLLKIEEISKYISMSNFIVNSDNITVLANKVLNSCSKTEEKNKYINEWKNIILRKSKDKDDFSQKLDYIKEFEYIINKSIDDLNNARKEFTSTVTAIRDKTYSLTVGDLNLKTNKYLLTNKN